MLGNGWSSTLRMQYKFICSVTAGSWLADWLQTISSNQLCQADRTSSGNKQRGCENYNLLLLGLGFESYQHDRFIFLYPTTSAQTGDFVIINRSIFNAMIHYMKLEADDANRTGGVGFYDFSE